MKNQRLYSWWNSTDLDSLRRRPSLPDARKIFNLLEAKNVFWADIDELPIPQYLSDNIDRIMAVTSDNRHSNEAFSRTIIDQILISAIYDENQIQNTQQQSSSQTKSDPAILELQHETQLQRQVTFRGDQWLLSGFADYTVCYDPDKNTNFATNIIIIEAKKTGFTDACLGQLTAYMGLVHSYRKDERKQNAVVYGAASDGLIFRFLRIDNDGNWSQSRLWEWGMGDKGKIYSLFRSLIRIAALSCPTTSPIKNPRKREGPCFLWQPTAKPQVRFCSRFVGAQGDGRRNRDGKNLEREGNFFYGCYSRAADNRSPILAHICCTTVLSHCNIHIYLTCINHTIA